MTSLQLTSSSADSCLPACSSEITQEEAFVLIFFSTGFTYWQCYLWALVQCQWQHCWDRAGHKECGNSGVLSWEIQDPVKRLNKDTKLNDVKWSVNQPVRQGQKSSYDVTISTITKGAKVSPFRNRFFHSLHYLRNCLPKIPGKSYFFRLLHFFKRSPSFKSVCVEANTFPPFPLTTNTWRQWW